MLHAPPAGDQADSPSSPRLLGRDTGRPGTQLLDSWRMGRGRGGPEADPVPRPPPRLQGPGLVGPPAAKAWLPAPRPGPACLRHVEGPSEPLATSAL